MNDDDNNITHYTYLIAQQEALEHLEKERLAKESDEYAAALEVSRMVEVEVNERRALKQEDEQIASALNVSAQTCHDLHVNSAALEVSRLEQVEVNERQAIKKEDEQIASALQVSAQTCHDLEVNAAANEAVIEWSVARGQDRNQGSWDCRVCSLINRPYASHCQACNTKAPDHILSFDGMQNIRFGLEIEIIVEGAKSDGFTLESIAQQLTSMGPPSVVFRGYSHETTTYWKIVTDASVGQNQMDDLCFELVSPILQGEDGLNSLREIMSNIRRLGIATNSSCGFHVHMDAEPGSPISSLASLKRIAQCFQALENAFDLLVSLSWDATMAHGRNRRANANQYCRSNRLALGSLSNRQRWQSIETAQSTTALVNLMNPGNDRYHKLNLTPIVDSNRPSTCEFRHHGGVENVPDAEAWVRLIAGFCTSAAARGPKSAACLLAENSSPQQELRALFDLVDCAGLEQFFVVERRLFSEYRLQNEWGCSGCCRTFGDSRALSQHKMACGH